MSKKVAIGIDLGTTNSCVGVYRNGKVDIIISETGNRIVPSYVGFDEDEIHIGEAAKAQVSANPRRSVYEVKRLIGCRFSEEKVQEDIKNWPFEVIDDDDAPKIKISATNGESKVFSPEEISAYVLAKLKKCAEDFIGSEVQDAVITVPAYFNDSQRQATIDAGRIAGLNVVSIINEPTAAAIAYGVDKESVQDQTVLVFDFGGGTFDVSILTIGNNKYVVKAVGGDTHLGGGDIDMLLVSHFLKILHDKHGKGLSENPRHLWRLREACEKAKIFLSTPSGFQTNVVLHGLLGGDDFHETLLRSKFEQINRDLFNKTMDIVKGTLQDAKMTPDDIDEVILIGGSSRIPKIQELLNSLFNGKKLNSTINPDEAVAYGAAVQAAIVTGEHTIEEIELSDVVPTSLGIENVFGNMVKFIERNTQIPTTAVQDTWSTVVDYQSEVTINVFEGEESQAKDNHLLGSFNLLIGERVKAGIPKLTITFEIDSNGIMNVRAENLNTNSTKEVTITANKGRLDEEDIKQMIKDGKQLKRT